MALAAESLLGQMMQLIGSASPTAGLPHGAFGIRVVAATALRSQSERRPPSWR